MTRGAVILLGLLFILSSVEAGPLQNNRKLADLS